MWFLIIYVIAFTSAASEKQLYSIDEAPEIFEEFIKKYNKQYDDKEKKERFHIFLENLNEINYRNERSTHANFDITKFTDLTNEEFIQQYTGYKSDRNGLFKFSKRLKTTEVFNYTVPDAFDWRSKNVVSKVKNQGSGCGSCWAFSTTGNVESINAIKSGIITEISEQQLVDCDKGSNGCSYGNIDSALKYLLANGAMSSQSYPYEEKEGSCNYNSNDVVIKIRDVESFQLTEEELKQKLYTTGPLSITIAADGLKTYSKQIVVDCDYQTVNHAVLLVGYGQENGVPFWIIKNSWGTQVGDEGYYRIKRGVNCLSLISKEIFTAIL